MPTAMIDHLEVNYVTRGSGPALLMLAPGGFDATMEKWATAGVWKGMRRSGPRHVGGALPARALAEAGVLDRHAARADAGARARPHPRVRPRAQVTRRALC